MIFPQHLEEIGHITPIDPEDLARMRDKVLLPDPEPRYGAALAKLAQLVNLSAGMVYVRPHESVTKDGHPYHVGGFFRKNPFAGIEEAKDALEGELGDTPVGIDSTMEVTDDLYGRFWADQGRALFDNYGMSPRPQGFTSDDVASMFDDYSVYEPSGPDQATPNEVAAYMSWGSVEGYMAMQDLLRGTNNSASLDRFQAHWNPRQTTANYAPQVEILKKAIARAPVTPEPMVVFRGFAQSQFGKLRTGQVVRDPGFVATITSIDFAKAYDEHGQPQALAEILLPAGTHALGYNGEITLPPGSRFRVLGTESPWDNLAYHYPGPEGEPAIADKFRTIVRMELISP